MDVGNFVKVVAADPSFYERTSMNGPDPLRLGMQGRIVKFAMNEQFETGWLVKLAGQSDSVFFFEEELEVIDQIEGPEIIRYKDRSGKNLSITKDELDRLKLPDWWNDPDQIRGMLMELETSDLDCSQIFGPFFTEEDAVRQHLENLMGGENEV